MLKKLFWLLVVALIVYSCWNSKDDDVRYRPIGGPVGQEITYEVMFQEIAAHYDLDWRLLALHAYYESSLNPQALGQANDMGLMQIIPLTWNEWAPKVGVSDPYDPYSNVLVGAAYLAFLREYFADQGYHDQRWMLIAYNWGPYNLDQFLAGGGDWSQVPDPQRRYALRILQADSTASISWDQIRTELRGKRSIRR